MISFCVLDVQPAPQGSKSQSRSGNMYEASKKLRPYRKALIEECQAMMLALGTPTIARRFPVVVTAEFVFGRPGRPMYDYPPRADTDKLQRAVGDALQLAGLLEDDGQITEWYSSKVYGPKPATWIMVDIAHALP